MLYRQISANIHSCRVAATPLHPRLTRALLMRSIFWTGWFAAQEFRSLCLGPMRFDPKLYQAFTQITGTRRVACFSATRPQHHCITLVCDKRVTRSTVLHLCERAVCMVERIWIPSETTRLQVALIFLSHKNQVAAPLVVVLLFFFPRLFQPQYIFYGYINLLAWTQVPGWVI